MTGHILRSAILVIAVLVFGLLTIAYGAHILR